MMSDLEDKGKGDSIPEIVENEFGESIEELVSEGSQTLGSDVGSRRKSRTKWR